MDTQKKCYEYNRTVHIKIKLDQLRLNWYPKYHIPPQLWLFLVHINHWMEKTCEILYTVVIKQNSSLSCNVMYIVSLLCAYLIIMHDAVHPVDTDTFNFIAIVYRVETIDRLSTKLEIWWYAWNMIEVWLTHHTIGFTGCTRRLIAY